MTERGINGEEWGVGEANLRHKPKSLETPFLSEANCIRCGKTENFPEGTAPTAPVCKDCLEFERMMDEDDCDDDDLDWDDDEYSEEEDEDSENEFSSDNESYFDFEGGEKIESN